VDKSSCWNAACTVLALCATAIGLPAQTFTMLASFNGANGAGPGYGALVVGSDGNFYGTTSVGGANDEGTIFKMTLAGILTTMYSFCSQASCSDGSEPFAGLIQASDGNFYGTTAAGGIGHQGTVFKITPAGTLTTLYSFCSQANCADGYVPYAGMIQASDGNLYGTTWEGGASDEGTVFKITPGGVLTTLYSFCPQAGCADGSNPAAGLIQGSDGNFYGTTWHGGANVWGTVFRITQGGALTTLYSFCSLAGCADGSGPWTGGLIQASDGNFYGTTLGGGANLSDGTVFKITPGGTLTTLHSFCPQGPPCAGGAGPAAALIQASDGNFYGTTSSSAPSELSAGTIFRITAGGALTTLYSFCSQAGCADGQDPSSALVQSADGNLYGTTIEGGASGRGTVFKLAFPSSTASPVIKQTGGILNGGSFQPGIVPGSWLTIFGTNLSSTTDSWTTAIVNGNLPTSLDNVKVSVGGEPAYVSYISPTQINALAPSSVETETVTVTNSGETSPAVAAAIRWFDPAFFQWPGNYAVATTLDYNLAVKNGTFPGATTTPAKPGQVIVLWGTGFGPTSPSAPVGVETPSGTTYNTATTVSVTVGGTAATVYGAALAPGYAGLYQVAIQIPASLVNGDYAVVATVSNAQSPSTTLITVQE
jgi:uncharacterized protein (TIGR03437 family)